VSHRYLAVPPYITDACLIEFNKCIASQNAIEWNHFMIGHIFKTFHSYIQYYYNINKLGKHFTSQRGGYNQIINFTLQIHTEAWIECCDMTHNPNNMNDNVEPTKVTLL